MKKKNFVILFGMIGLIILIGGVTYAWFNYYKEGEENEVIAGDIYFNLLEGNDSISLQNVFPETKEEARERNDNTMTFSINGKNESDKAVWYEILLNKGADVSGKNRFLDKHLVFDLTRINGNDRTLLLDAVGFDEINNTKLWVDYVDANTNTELTRTYEIRMWLSDTVRIGEGNVDYTSSEFANSYANIKVAVDGNTIKKSYPLTFNHETTLNNFSLSLSNDYTNSEFGNATNDTIELKVSSTDSNVKFNYSYTIVTPATTENGEDTEQEISNTNQSNVDITINYAINETKAISLQVKNAATEGSNIIFEIIKNGVIVQKFIKTVYRTISDKNIMDIFPTTINNVNLKNTLTSISFVNVNRANLNSEYDLEDANVYDLTLQDNGEKIGDVRGKLNGTTLTIASDGKTYLSTGYRLFSDFINLKSINFTNIDTSLVTNMFGMFFKSNKLTSLDLSNFDTSNVQSMISMFNSCSGLTNLNLGSQFNTGNVKDVSYMFYKCSGLTSIDLENHFETRNVTNMANMFNECSNMTNINLGNYFDTSNVTNMGGMFYKCSGLTSLDLGNYFDTSNVTRMSSMFSECSNITNINLGNKFNTENVKDMTYMFYGCSSLTSLDLGNHFETRNVTNMANMFNGCSNMTNINLGNKFNSGNVIDISYMFYHCSGLTNINLGSQFNTGNVVKMRAVFSGCSGLTGLDLGDLFDTSNVTDMLSMFGGCVKLVSLNLGGKFDTSNVIEMSYMFYNCSLLEKIYVEKSFVISNGLVSTSMFSLCKSLVGGSGTNYSSSNVNATYARIDEPNNGKPGYFTYKASSIV